MAQAIASALLAVPDRPMAERPEAKGSDGSDGRFAGLMAQFVPSPAPTETSKPLHDGPADEEQAAPSKPIEAQAASGTPPPIAQANPSGPIQEAHAGTPEVPQGASGAAPAPSQGLQRLASAEAETVTKVGAANSWPPTAPVGAIPVAPLAAPAWAQLRGTTALSSTEPEALPLPVEASPKVEIPPPALSRAGAEITVSVLATSSTTPALSSATTPTLARQDPIPSPGPGVAQAVLAESKPGLKETPRPERMVTTLNASPLESPQPALKAWRADEAPTLSLPLSPSPVKPPWHATAPVIGPATDRKGPAETAEGPIPAPARTDSASVRPDSTPSAPDSPVPKASLSIQPAVSHGIDGSPLAALGALPRAAGSPQAPVPQAPLAAAPPPSAPMTQVEGGLRWMLKGGSQEARLQLHPESLGQVTIHLKVEGGEVHARLWITEAASVKVVQEGRPHLEMALKEQGLQLGSFDLQQGQRPFREAPTPSPFREHTAPEAPPARQEAPVAAPPSILNPHRIELYA